MAGVIFGAIVAALVYLITHSWVWALVAFLGVPVLSLLLVAAWGILLVGHALSKPPRRSRR